MKSPSPDQHAQSGKRCTGNFSSCPSDEEILSRFNLYRWHSKSRRPGITAAKAAYPSVFLSVT